MSLGNNKNIVIDTTPATDVIGEIKKRTDGESVSLAQKTVTAVFADHFYIEETDRSAGIRVVPPFMPDGLEFGDTVNVSGTIETNSDDERYVHAISVKNITPGEALAPVGMNSDTLGGEDTPEYDAETGAGQKGVEGGEGTNTIGRLAKLTEEVTAVGSDFFYLNDGCEARDFSVFRGIRVRCPGLVKPNSGSIQAVTGISQMMKVNNRLFRTIRPRDGSDIVAQS